MTEETKYPDIKNNPDSYTYNELYCKLEEYRPIAELLRKGEAELTRDQLVLLVIQEGKLDPFPNTVETFRRSVQSMGDYGITTTDKVWKDYVEYFDVYYPDTKFSSFAKFRDMITCNHYSQIAAIHLDVSYDWADICAKTGTLFLDMTATLTWTTRHGFRCHYTALVEGKNGRKRKKKVYIPQHLIKLFSYQCDEDFSEKRFAKLLPDLV